MNEKASSSAPCSVGSPRRLSNSKMLGDCPVLSAFRQVRVVTVYKVGWPETLANKSSLQRLPMLIATCISTGDADPK